MFEPEYRASFGVLRRELGFWPTLQTTISSMLKSRKIQFEENDNDDVSTRKKNVLKNHFKLFAILYKELKNRYDEEKTLNIMHEILIQCGPIFMRGFKLLGPHDDLSNFMPIYKEFESQNLIFDVIEESSHRFEIVVRRCLILEAFKDLGLEIVTQWMCDIAFLYFSNYHPDIKYKKDQMIAKGDKCCHEVFIWQD